MTTHPGPIDQALTLLRTPHQVGHVCGDLCWYNPNAGARRPCPATDALTVIGQRLNHLHNRVHAAAHDDAAAVHVAEAMTGLTIRDLPLEEAAGWTQTARMAIEGLCEWLDAQERTEEP